MCCLFGFVDYGHKLTRKQRQRLLYALSTSAEGRGTDATGLACVLGGRQSIDHLSFSTERSVCLRQYGGDSAKRAEEFSPEPGEGGTCPCIHRGYPENRRTGENQPQRV